MTATLPEVILKTVVAVQVLACSAMGGEVTYVYLVSRSHIRSASPISTRLSGIICHDRHDRYILQSPSTRRIS